LNKPALVSRETNQPPVAILGGGMTGLAAGWASGLPVYEAEEDVFPPTNASPTTGQNCPAHMLARKVIVLAIGKASAQLLVRDSSSGGGGGRFQRRSQEPGFSSCQPNSQGPVLGGLPQDHSHLPVQRHDIGDNRSAEQPSG